MKVAWQTWIVIVLMTANAVVAKVQDPSSGFTVPAGSGWSLVIFGLSIFIPLATNQLKAVGSDTPPTPPKQDEKPPQ